jgi:hypothetical protein
MVLIVDESTGMSNGQKALKSKIPDLFKQLAAQAPGSRVGLVGYGGNSVQHPYTPHLHTMLTDKQSTFQSAANKLIASGNTEPGYWSTYATVSNVVSQGSDFSLGFRPNLPFCVVLFTDEPSNGDGSITKDNVIAALKNSPQTNEANAPGTFIGVVNSLAIDSYQPLAVATRGEIVSLSGFVSKPTDTLKAIVRRCTISINRITLTPRSSNLTGYFQHSLTIGTNQLSASVLYSQPYVQVTLTVLDGPDQNSLLYSGPTDKNGKYTFNYLPSVIFGGTITFNACLQDDPTVCATSQATWPASLNKNPSPINDVYTTNINSSLTIVSPGVLENDSDPNRNTITVDVADSDGKSIHNGDVIWSTSGGFTYNPPTDFHGNDTFSYTVVDGHGGVAHASVTVVVNRPPLAMTDTYSTRINKPLMILISDLLKNDVDPDGNTLTLESFTQPDKGGSLTGTDVDLTYTPDADFDGIDTFTYTISDGYGGKVTANVTITVSGYEIPGFTFGTGTLPTSCGLLTGQACSPPP